MTDGRRDREDGRPEPLGVADGRALTDHDPPELASTLVRYDDRPDRITIYPGEQPTDECLTTWLSVDSDLVVGLRETR